jgi:hypothetical protein
MRQSVTAAIGGSRAMTVFLSSWLQADTYLFERNSSCPENSNRNYVMLWRTLLELACRE